MKTVPRKIPELLAPAGSFEKLVTAVHYGADAVYLAGKRFSLRARAGNFDEDGLRQAVAYAHDHGVKVYITINIFAHNRDLEGLEEYLRFLRGTGADALIIADPGILLTAGETVPELPIHLSTQANVSNAASARFWGARGVARLNLARELGLEEIKEIRAAMDTELEVFVHGALCISYSGRCMLSNYLTGRDANRGDCAHPCRYSYRLVEEKRPGQYYPVEEDERGTYIFNSQDLCLLGRLPELVAAGVDSLKIEGRMKAVGYVAGVVRVYRAVLDWIDEQVRSGREPAGLQVPVHFTDELLKLGTRGRTENFFDNPPDSSDMLYDRMRVEQCWAPVGIVRQSEPLIIETRNVLEIGDTIEYLGRGFVTTSCIVTKMSLADGTSLERANPGNRVALTTEPEIQQPEVACIFRKEMIK
ncbi:MAG: U32 family peptidase C-terminal domain-containing protein [Desulfobulbaceae bacterium]|nr:U32 family peptidase C-terminal domain-containing protein [Desulfobulbaceae bacterium]